MVKRNLRIHGDNIVECERTLKMISEAYNSTCELLHSPLYLPKYQINNDDCCLEIELLSGHGRWSNIDMGDTIYKAGGHSRETADSYLTEIKENSEIVILAIEYCSALPAGNNAWQRNGRALASALANVPYLYYAEIGGIELDGNRNPKQPRYPNPAVPFSYVSLSHDMNRVCLPVYMAHPSMTNQNKTEFNTALGYHDGLSLIRHIINGEDTSQIVNSLKNKALKMVEILTSRRKEENTIKSNEWNEFLTSIDRPGWLGQNYREIWQKKTSQKVKVSETFTLLKSEARVLSAIPVAARDLPLCIIPKQNLPILKHWMKKTYNNLEIPFDTDKDLALVWITGFKPKGDDSRPDRGLSPLCRMILGKKANIMAILSGPGKNNTWETLVNSPKELCEKNGLFESIFSYCNYLFVDSKQLEHPIFLQTKASLTENTQSITIPYIHKPVAKFSEHDTDCAIHQILSSHRDMGIFECFCNPPGGDWSGISYYESDKEYKWTSLPRVSEQSKRPDHIFQIEKNGKIMFVTIESKGYGKDLEKNIGQRLKDYIKDLLGSEPTAYRQDRHSEWNYFDGNIGKVKYGILSVGAFLYKNECELPIHLNRGNLDAVFAFEFDTITTLHLHFNAKGKILLKHLRKIASEQRGFVIKVHRF